MLELYAYAGWFVGFFLWLILHRRYPDNKFVTYVFCGVIFPVTFLVIIYKLYKHFRGV